MLIWQGKEILRRLQGSECLPIEDDEGHSWAKPSQVVVGSSLLLDVIPSSMLERFLGKHYLRQVQFSKRI